MTFPTSFPGRRSAFGLLLAYAAIWLMLEGDLRRDFMLSGLILVTVTWSLVARYLAGRSLSLRAWVLLFAASGMVLGASMVLLTLFLMALKTGLHAHGPEYTPGELAWVWDQLPAWSAIGLLAGTGAGLFLAGINRP